ncbi:MAG: GatB/YqeY domain-containing protein [Pseudomonadota bacterium]
MDLKERINEDMKAAMRAREADRLGAIRLLLAAMKQKEVDERVQLSDADVVLVIEKMLKQRRDSISQFEVADRTDLADKEKFEVSLLQTYMPQALSEDEVAAIVGAAIAEIQAAGIKDMGKVMAVVKPKIAGRADVAKVSALVKERLGG